MNKRTIAAIGGVMLATAALLAQDTTAQPTPGVQPLANATYAEMLKQAAKDAKEQFTTISFKEGYRVTGFGIRHDSDYGGGLAVFTGRTNGLNAGFAIAAVNEKSSGDKNTRKQWNFYDATLSLSYNGTMTIPLLGWEVPTYVETGPATDLRNPNQLYSQSIAGFEKSFDISKWIKRSSLSIGGGVGYLSRWSGPFQIATVSFNHSF